MSYEKECLGASDEGIYEQVRVRRLFVANSRHLVLARIKTPKNSYKIHESAVSGTLLTSGFQIFVADAAFQNRAPRDFFTHRTKKMPYHFQIFARKHVDNYSPSMFYYWYRTPCLILLCKFAKHQLPIPMRQAS